jgi:glucose-1-phosphate thymidylyltransferase
MQGIVMAGGSGSRLWPVTAGVSKQLLPVYDKPMIYYPLSVLMLAGIREILIITTPEDQHSYQRLLGTGANFGISLSYAVQQYPSGIAQAFSIGKDFIGNEDLCLILGDNIFYGHGFSDQLMAARDSLDGGTIFAYPVADPSRFGVVEIGDSKAVLNLEEKPYSPKSELAVTGLYFYKNEVLEVAKDLKPSGRGELEITDVNKAFLDQGKLKCEVLGRGFAWLDTGTHESLLDAGKFVQTIEDRQGLKVACLEEIALNQGWATPEMIENIRCNTGTTGYGRYLKTLLDSL